MLLKVTNCPSEELSLKNVMVVNSMKFNNVKAVKVTVDRAAEYVVSVKCMSEFNPNEIGLSFFHRKWLDVELGKEVDVVPLAANALEPLVMVTIEIDLHKKYVKPRPEVVNTDEMAQVVLKTFNEIAFSESQYFAIKFNEKVFVAYVKELEAVSSRDLESGSMNSRRVLCGLVNSVSAIKFLKPETSQIKLMGSCTDAMKTTVFAADFDFNNFGIGGLNNQFSEMLRRTFTSRMFSSTIFDKCGGKHVKGLMLYGPPGTGKTLLARKIGQMLQSHPPKVVNGPEVLNKFVGESEANIRRLFAEAEEEEKLMGPASQLHIIIFDEIDAICKQRSTSNSTSGVHDTVVNQLLSKMDGVEQLNNILIIGMTNRLDLIDEALLRPGRFEVKIEIGLPDEKGRIQILNIHTSKIRENNMISDDVDLDYIAKITKNYTGAELEAVVRSSVSSMLNRGISVKSKIEILDDDTIKNLKVSQSDFMYAIEYDVKPAFGMQSDFFSPYSKNPLYLFNSKISEIFSEFAESKQSLESFERESIVSVLIEGEANSGLTTMACRLAIDSGFPLVKACTHNEMMGYSESMKCLQMRKIFQDAYKSPLSLIVIDNIEHLLDYGPIGPRYSTVLLIQLDHLLKKIPPNNCRLMVIVTSKYKSLLQDLKLITAFSKTFHMPKITDIGELQFVLQESNSFDRNQVTEIADELKFQELDIGIKDLLLLIRESNNNAKRFLEKLRKFHENI